MYLIHKKVDYLKEYFNHVYNNESYHFKKNNLLNYLTQFLVELYNSWKKTKSKYAYGIIILFIHQICPKINFNVSNFSLYIFLFLI